MINVNIRIITRTIPATPRSRDYPQGYLAASKTNNPKLYEVKSRTVSQPQDIIQFVRDNRAEVISALMEDGVISIDGSLRATGEITPNQILE